MAVPTLQELFEPLTMEEVLAIMFEVATALDLPVTAWQSQEETRELLTLFAQKGADFSVVGAAAAGAGLLDYSSGAWLTLTSHELYEVDRTESTAGTCTERLTNAGDVAYPFDAGDLRFLNSSTGATYTNTEPGTSPANGTVDITIVADEPGTASSAAVGAIDAFVTPLINVTCSNTTALVGVDELNDDGLKALDRASLAKASPNGPEDAYDYYAKTALRTDGGPVGVTRTNLVQLNGSNLLYVANASGEVDGPVDDPTTDLYAVNANIQNNVVPTGLTTSVYSAEVLDVTIDATVYISSSATVTDTQVKQAVLDQLLTYFAALPIGGFDIGGGGKLFLDAIIGQIFLALPGQIVQVTIASPVSDVSISSNQVAVLLSTVDDITVMPAVT